MKKSGLLLLIAAIPLFVFAQKFGDKTHPINKKTPNIEVLKYWNKGSPEMLELFGRANDVFAKDYNATYADLLADKTFVELCKKNNIHKLGGPLLGNISDDGVSIWIRTSKPSKVQIKLLAGVSITVSESIQTTVENDLAGVIHIRGLKPGTKYFYRILIDNKVQIVDEKYVFETLGNKSNSNITRITFGSCPHRWGLGNNQLFNTIKEREPAAMLLLGDIAVQDRMNHLGMHRADYLLRDFQGAWSDFACSIPVYASWDDHDYFNNDKAGLPQGLRNKDRRSVRDIFLKSWSNPSYGLDDEGIYFKTTIGSCDVIMTDNRYFREMGSFLGKRQMDWIKEAIVSCQSPFLILSCGTMWDDAVSDGKDSWGRVDPEGREEIFKLIEDKNISGVLLISGDRHGARGFTIDRKSGFQFHEFGAASLGGRRGPSISKPEWIHQLYGIDGIFAFGEFTFDTTEGKENVVFQLIKEDGEIVYKKKILLSDMMPNN